MASARPPQPPFLNTMRVSHLESWNQPGETKARTVTCVASSTDWIAVNMQKPPDSIVDYAWEVVVYRRSAKEESVQDTPVHVTRQRPGRLAAPHYMDISEDAVLAIAVYPMGVRYFVLGSPVGPVTEPRVVELPVTTGDPIGVCKFIDLATATRAMVGFASYPDKKVESINVYSNVTKSSTATVLATHHHGSISGFDAAPGIIVVLVAEEQMLYLLRLVDGDQFSMTQLNLLQLAHSRPAMGLMQPCGVAACRDTFVIGYKPAIVTSEGMGLVEVFSTESGQMIARRGLPGALPTGLALSGRRVLVGTCLIGHKDRIVHIFHADQPDNFAIGRGISDYAIENKNLAMTASRWCFGMNSEVQTGEVSLSAVM